MTIKVEVTFKRGNIDFMFFANERELGNRMTKPDVLSFEIVEIRK